MKSGVTRTIPYPPHPHTHRKTARYCAMAFHIFCDTTATTFPLVAAMQVGDTRERLRRSRCVEAEWNNGVEWTEWTERENGERGLDNVCVYALHSAQGNRSRRAEGELSREENCRLAVRMEATNSRTQFHRFIIIIIHHRRCHRRCHRSRPHKKDTYTRATSVPSS